ncbi:MAG: DUF5340 domain-containing protein [Cyanobacteria bacterium P01_A01_bin.135]
MNPIPLPSHLHYEALLQLLEQQTLPSLDHSSPQRGQVLEIIITLRKALSLQKRLEETCERENVIVDYRWSLSEWPIPKS